VTRDSTFICSSKIAAVCMVVEASADEGLLLGVSEGAALLLITRVTRDEAGDPIEYSHDLFRADRTRIVVRTPGTAGTAEAVHTKGPRVELHTQPLD
jgi:GntR family transcriptional regulator